MNMYERLAELQSRHPEHLFKMVTYSSPVALLEDVPVMQREGWKLVERDPTTAIWVRDRYVLMEQL